MLKQKWSFLIVLVLLWNLTACSQERAQPLNTAYPGPVTSKIVSNTPTPTKTILPSLTPRPISTISPTRTVFLPTHWRDFTPTPNSTPGIWPEFSSEITYANSFNGSVVGPLHFTITYPSDWYLYPGYTVTHPGEFLQGTFIQNFKRIDDVPDESLSVFGSIMLIINAAPCDVTEQGCPTDLPLLSSGLPGTRDIRYQSSNNYTYWDAYLYAKDMQFGLHGYMLGTPEENAELIKTLDEILATVKLW